MKIEKIRSVLIKMQRLKNIQRTTWLLFLCWLVYTVSLLGKVNYAANITQIESFYKVSHADAGMASTFYFFAYGIGQVVNGLLCKKYNLKYNKAIERKL